MTAPDHDHMLVELARHQRAHYFGKYRGIVTDNRDSDRQGRLMVKVPGLLADQELRAWPSLPFAGKNHGLVFTPEPGDGVWVEFEAGQLSHPIWSGCWLAEGEAPPAMAPDCQCLITSKGLQILLDDQHDRIVLKHGLGASITLDGTGITLQVGAAKLALTAAGLVVNNGALEVST